MSAQLRFATAIIVSAAVLAAPLGGPAQRVARAATGTLAIVPGELTPVDIGVVYHYTTTSAIFATYTNANPEPVTISGFQVGQQFGRWSAVSSTCMDGPIAPQGSCVIGLSFFASVTAHYSVDEALLLVADGSAEGAVGTLTAHIAPRPSQETWLAPNSVRGSGTNSAPGIDRTTTPSAEYLHAVFTGDTVNGVPVGDHGPYRLVSYTRTQTDGETWSAPVRLNAATHHGTDPTVAAAGSTLYAAWTRVTDADLGTGGPRILYLRVNRSHGSGSWEQAVRLTSKGGRAMNPRVAAGGPNVYVAYTDGNTGDVRVAISNDRGRSWRTKTLGLTTRGADGSHDAGVSVAADASGVLVSWVASGSGTVKSRGSLLAGARWTPTRSAGTGADAGTATSATIVDGHGGIGWVDGDTLRWSWTYGARLITAEHWTTGELLVDYLPGNYRRFESVAVNMRSKTRIGMAYQVCRVTCNKDDAAYRSDIFWQESPGWSPNLVFGETGSALRSARPSAIWASPSLRVLAATVVDPDTGKERVRVRLGIGLP